MSRSSPALCALLGVLLCAPAWSHGGVYRGPGATVGPGGASGGGPSSNTGGLADSDPAAWSQWWSFNRDRYLALRDAVFKRRVDSGGDDDFDLGAGAMRAVVRGLRPDRTLLAESVQPALLAALEGQKDVDMITACLLALAKIGPVPGGHENLGGLLRTWITHSNQEVHETAVIALGVMADQESAALLANLLLDTPAGRAATGRSRVPERTRAFAAYGLGLVGYRAERRAVRRFAVHQLARAIPLGEKPMRDRLVATVIAMGLVPLQPAGVPPGGDAPAPSASREGQLTLLLTLWEEEGLDARVRAHLPVPMARLTAGLSEGWKQRLVLEFTAVLSPRSKASPMVRHGVLLASGLLGDNDLDPPDVLLRAALEDALEGGDRLGRHLALLALGRVGAREGRGERGDAPDAIRSRLLRLLARGKSAQRPWAALALGILERGNAAGGRPLSEELRTALLQAFGSAASPSEEGALAIALGLVAERRAIEPLIERSAAGDENTRANAMIALGLMQAQEAVPTLLGIVRTTTLKPGIMREASIALALLGDRSAAHILVARLRSSALLVEQVSSAWALGFVGDSAVVPALVGVLQNRRLSDTTRAYAAVALGLIGDKERYPWNSKIAADVLWWQAPATLFDPRGGKGILDLL